MSNTMPDNAFNSLLVELMEECAKCKSHIRMLEVEIRELRRRKGRRTSAGLIAYVRRRYTENGVQRTSSFQKENSDSEQDRMFEIVQSVADMHQDLRNRYWLSLKQLAEQKIFWRSLVQSYQEILPVPDQSTLDFGAKEKQDETMKTTEKRKHLLSASKDLASPYFHSSGLQRKEDGNRPVSPKVSENISPLVRTKVNVTQHVAEIDEIPYKAPVTSTLPSASTLSAPKQGQPFSSKVIGKIFPLVRTEINVTKSLTEIDDIPYTAADTCHHPRTFASSMPKQEKDGDSSKLASPTKGGCVNNQMKNDPARLGKSAALEADESTKSVLRKQKSMEKLPTIANTPGIKVEPMGLPCNTILETERERYKLKIKSLVADNRDKDDIIDALQEQVKTKDAQINQLAKTVYVSRRIKKWK